MRNAKVFVATLLAGTVASAVAMADSLPQGVSTAPIIAVGPPTSGAPIYPVTCLMGSGDVTAEILIRNSSSAAISEGAEIHWQILGWFDGTFHAGQSGLAPGQLVQVGVAHYPFTCSASL